MVLAKCSSKCHFSSVTNSLATPPSYGVNKLLTSWRFVTIIIWPIITTQHTLANQPIWYNIIMRLLFSDARCCFYHVTANWCALALNSSMRMKLPPTPLDFCYCMKLESLQGIMLVGSQRVANASLWISKSCTYAYKFESAKLWVAYGGF